MCLAVVTVAAMSVVGGGVNGNGELQIMWDIDLLCDVWNAWTFQVNFMYEKFL